MLNGGRRYAATVAIAACIGIAGAPHALAADIDVSGGSVVNNITLDGGGTNPATMDVYSGGTANSTNISSGGR